jgi:HrpA-like RNA helicase
LCSPVFLWVSFRLYTESFFCESLVAHPVSELQRSDLAPVVLQLKALGIDNLMRFDFPAPPPTEAMLRSLELLYALGFLDSDARLTHPAGKQAAELPLVRPSNIRARALPRLTRIRSWKICLERKTDDPCFSGFLIGDF